MILSRIDELVGPVHGPQGPRRRVATGAIVAGDEAVAADRGRRLELQDKLAPAPVLAEGHVDPLTAIVLHAVRALAAAGRPTARTVGADDCDGLAALVVELDRRNLGEREREGGRP